MKKAGNGLVVGISLVVASYNIFALSANQSVRTWTG